MDTVSTRAFLLEHIARYPAARLRDLRKALYQSTFGCGHLVADPSAAAERIREEALTAADCRAPRPLDGPWQRVPLGILRDGLTAETLAAAFARSAALPHEDTAALEARLSVLMTLIREGALPFSVTEATAELAAWRAAGYPACHHSEAYRAAYRPAYRVLHTTYVRLLPLLTAIDRALAARERVLLAIEGGAGSGKSTLAALLADLYGGAVFHADDFFLRPEQRTEARFSQPGGNLDRERLEAELLSPLRWGEAGTYRPFDCHTMALSAPRAFVPARLNIVEGSYSFHPTLASYYDLSVFLEVSAGTQRRRILERNGPTWGQRFFDRWIPLENVYFRETDIRTRCTLTLAEDPASAVREDIEKGGRT